MLYFEAPVAESYPASRRGGIHDGRQAAGMPAGLLSFLDARRGCRESARHPRASRRWRDNIRASLPEYAVPKHTDPSDPATRSALAGFRLSALPRATGLHALRTSPYTRVPPSLFRRTGRFRSLLASHFECSHSLPPQALVWLLVGATVAGWVCRRWEGGRTFSRRMELASIPSVRQAKIPAWRRRDPMGAVGALGNASSGFLRPPAH